MKAPNIFKDEFHVKTITLRVWAKYVLQKIIDCLQSNFKQGSYM